MLVPVVTYMLSVVIMQELTLPLRVSAALGSQALVTGLSNVDAVEGAKCASSKGHANCWSCAIVWRTMRPVTQRSKSVFGTSSESHLDLLHVNLAMSLRTCIDAISAPSALFAGTDMPSCFVVVT